MIAVVLTALCIVVAVLGVGGATTNVGLWYQGLRKPAWNPPNWAFGPAWAVILSLAGAAGVLAWLNTDTLVIHVRVAALFALNIFFHMLWSPLFFNLRRPDWALIEMVFLWLSVLALIIGIYPISRFASVLLAPYLAWVTFAGFLNLAVVRLNPRFHGST